ncbi:MAG: cytochrome c3 family protein [Cytophagales bacterium]|nr:c-type cytochrome [Bernardetiaceae bacterium]MDW8205608.1 cytochrome c3 family protein [Cytophagales bacterium]
MLRFKFPSLLALIVWCAFACSVPVFAQDGGNGDGGSTTDSAPAAASSAAGLSADQAVIEQGKGLFNANCKQCHAVHEKVVGPALAKVYERRTIPWLINFIKYPQRVIESGDAYAVALYKEYQQYMPNHDFLKDDEIKAILSWVQAETIKGPATAAATATTTGTAATASGGEANSGLLTAVIAGLAFLLIVTLAVLALMAATLSKYLKKETDLSEEDRELLEQRVDWAGIFKSQAFIGITAFVFLALVLKATVEGLITIGVQQGYAPTQPIPFSHKLHAGEYEIDCKYCHTGVEKGKSANIPSANICMNCHNAIKTTSPIIQKIYEHIEKDEPIQWVRVHNLPDLAYFNHQQHVKVAGLDCENCHGNIKEMEVVQQVSLLTMGWCIDCHRKTDVNAKGNAYYDNLVQLHAKSSKTPMKVEDIGGLECAKCHY